MYALLIAEDQDESAVCSLVLQRAGMAVTTARDVDRALRSWSERPADIILAVLGDQDPLDQVRRVRAQTEVPLVVITPPVREDLHYALLETGADMLIQRPYSSRLLIAQIRALLRRAGGVPLTVLPALSLSGLTLDPATHSVRRADAAPKRLTHLEFRLLYTLMIHRDQVLPTDTIVQRVWGYAADGGSRELVRGLISRLRAKVERDPRQPQYIHTIPGVGYAFQTDEGAGLEHLG
jgi:DNA-binding response OmpR family regulator